MTRDPMNKAFPRRAPSGGHTGYYRRELRVKRLANSEWLFLVNDFHMTLGLVWSQDTGCKTEVVRILEGTDSAFISSGTMAAENITIKMRECPVAGGYLLFCYRRLSQGHLLSQQDSLYSPPHLRGLATVGLRIFGYSVWTSFRGIFQGYLSPQKLCCKDTFRATWGNTYATHLSISLSLSKTL